MEPLVSILIPAFNAERWIAEAIRSAIGQTWRRTEIIVVDDGSTDRTLAIARRFGSPTLKVVSCEHENASAARNRAFAMCQGDFVQWLDSDDLLAPQKIERQLAAAAREPPRTVFSCAWGKFIYRENRARFEPTPLWTDLSPLEWILRKMKHNSYMQTATWLVPRQVVEVAGPWDTRLLSDDDGEFFCRVLMKCDRVVFVPGAKVLYRMARTESLGFVGQSDEKLDAQFRSVDLHIAHVRMSEDSQRVRAACLEYLQTSLGYFHPWRPDLVGKLQGLALTLGGRLELPTLPWKYSWVASLFGIGLAKRAQIALPQVRWALVRYWDRIGAWLERSRSHTSW